MRTPRVTLAALCLTASVACSDSNRYATTPTQPELPEATPSQVQVWSLVMTMVSVTGPEESCFWRERMTIIAHDSVGEREEGHLEVAELENGRIELQWACDDWDWCGFQGTIDGSEFVATSETGTWSYDCIAGGVVELEHRNELEGSFSADRQALTAVERRIYREAGGEHVVTLEWQATFVY